MSQKLLLLVFATLTILLCTFEGSARHIVGGEITYECTGEGFGNSRNYRIVMKLYRDCYADGALFDNPGVLGIYTYIDSVYTFIRTASASPTNPVELAPPDNPCLILPEDVCVEEAIYVYNINNLPIIDGSYIISWQRCCRNNTITNIYNPEATGATYTVEITRDAQIECNSSPRFNSFPPTIICIGEPLDYDHSASDAENDQLVYEFCAPLEGGGPLGSFENPGDPRACNGITPDPTICLPPYQEVNFIGPLYSEINPLAGNPTITIDPSTGRITGTPEIFGQFVVGVCVKEFRNGRLLSVLRRDFQFNVENCEPVVEAKIQSDATIGQQEYVINSCGNNTITFVNESTLEQNISSYKWEFQINNQVEILNEKDATVTFPGIGLYTGMMIINEGTQCADTADISVNVYPSIEADFAFEYDTCVAGPVSFTDLSTTGSGQMTNWDWDFGDGGFSQNRNPFHTYPDPGLHPVSLRVRDVNACEAEIEKEINYYPVPPLIIIEPNTFLGCTPAEISFRNLSVPIDTTYDIVWDFGDGNAGFEISPTHQYTEPGTYSVNIQITSPIGCYTEARFPNWITVRNSPVADFDFSPDDPSQFDAMVQFVDQSTDAVAWQWDFDGQGRAFTQNPSFAFQDTGRKAVELVVFHENGCLDTIVKYLDIQPEITFYLPNAFTPNGDAKNDLFRGIGIFDGIEDFNMSIWNRWGEMVFQTNDPEDGWNGRKNNTGEDLPQGVYVVIVQYHAPREGPVEMKGFATLIR